MIKQCLRNTYENKALHAAKNKFSKEKIQVIGYSLRQTFKKVQFTLYQIYEDNYFLIMKAKYILTMKTKILTNNEYQSMKIIITCL